jgi:uncharacterized protein YqgC (DUF456 family)
MSGAVLAFVYVLVALLLIAGLVGSVLPALPGTILILLAAALHAFATGFDPIGPGRLAILGLLTAAAYALDHVAGVLGVKRLGGSGWAMGGAVVGALVGLFFGLPGLVLGPLLGALVAEYAYTRQVGTSARAALGTVVGLLVGAVAKVGLGLAMIGLFLSWVWRG